MFERSSPFLLFCPGFARVSAAAVLMIGAPNLVRQAAGTVPDDLAPVDWGAPPFGG